MRGGCGAGIREDIALTKGAGGEPLGKEPVSLRRGNPHDIRRAGEMGGAVLEIERPLHQARHIERDQRAVTPCGQSLRIYIYRPSAVTSDGMLPGDGCPASSAEILNGDSHEGAILVENRQEGGMTCGSIQIAKIKVLAERGGSQHIAAAGDRQPGQPGEGEVHGPLGNNRLGGVHHHRNILPVADLIVHVERKARSW